jgi:hypothetical protein
MSMSEKRRFKAILGAEPQLKDTWLSADDKLADLEIVSGKEGIEPSFNLHRLRPLRLFIARIVKEVAVPISLLKTCEPHGWQVMKTFFVKKRIAHAWVSFDLH